MITSSSLVDSAKDAVAGFPESDVECAMAFCEKVLPEFVGESSDRLIKVARRLRCLVDMEEEIPLEESLALVVEECRLLISGNVKVPKVRFGKTELQMPICSVGCMRFQQEWGPRINKMNMVGGDCQDNLAAILKRAVLDYGINHIETARGYGCSELQLGVAIKQLLLTNQIKREDLIIQTKVVAFEDPEEFRSAIETSMKSLQVEYLDLLGIHGVNTENQFGWIMEGEENCLKVAKEYMEAGKVRHLGFSTHGPTDLIMKLIGTGHFDYVNLHYNFFGSYTASGGGHDGHGNLDCLKLAHEKDMGVFAISPVDKGGALYRPSRKLVSLCLPQMEPTTFGIGWLWNHHPKIHTFSIGAGRPADLDQAAVAAYLQDTKANEMLKNIKTVADRLTKEKDRALGKEWAETWWKGLPKSYKSKFHIEHNQVVWLYNSIKAFGLYEFAKTRYQAFEKNQENWDKSKSPEENMSNRGWGFVPGLPLKPGADYSEDFGDVPEENKLCVREAEDFVYKWCAGRMAKPEDKSSGTSSFFPKNFPVPTPAFPKLPGFLLNDSEEERKRLERGEVPKEWQTAYDYRPWPDYPDRTPRK